MRNARKWITNENCTPTLSGWKLRIYVFPSTFCALLYANRRAWKPRTIIELNTSSEWMAGSKSAPFFFCSFQSFLSSLCVRFSVEVILHSIWHPNIIDFTWNFAIHSYRWRRCPTNWIIRWTVRSMGNNQLNNYHLAVTMANRSVLTPMWTKQIPFSHQINKRRLPEKRRSQC